jgi:hypothetical protein
VLAPVKVHERVALPAPVTLVGLTAHAVLLVDRLTIPEKPFNAVVVTVDVPALPAFTVTVVGLAFMVKSWIVKVTFAEWKRLVLAPVTATGTVEAEVKEHERVELPEPEILVGDRVHAVLLLVRLTIPAKPLSPEMAMVEVTVEPALPVTPVGLAAIAKS